MNNGITKFLVFTTGAAIGSVVTWKIVKTKYERIVQEEAAALKAYYKKKYPVPEKQQIESEVAEYVNQVQEMGYSSEQNIEKGEPETMSKPYVISPDEFDENGYETISLTYYPDGVLVDDMGEIVDDVDDTVGTDSLNHFGEYEDDSVFVRNDERKVDFEILLAPRNYSDVENRPHSVDE